MVFIFRGSTIVASSLISSFLRIYIRQTGRGDGLFSANHHSSAGFIEINHSKMRYVHFTFTIIGDNEATEIAITLFFSFQKPLCEWLIDDWHELAYSALSDQCTWKYAFILPLGENYDRQE